MIEPFGPLGTTVQRKWVEFRSSQSIDVWTNSQRASMVTAYLYIWHARLGSILVGKLTGARSKRFWRAAFFCVFWTAFPTAAYAQPFSIAQSHLGQPQSIWLASRLCAWKPSNLSVHRSGVGRAPDPCLHGNWSDFRGLTNVDPPERRLLSPTNAHCLQRCGMPIFGAFGLGYIGFSGAAIMRVDLHYLAMEADRTMLAAEFTNKSQVRSLLDAWRFGSGGTKPAGSKGQRLWSTSMLAQESRVE